MNRVYLFKSPSTDTVCIGIGTGDNKRKVWMSDEEALKLAYRLMSLGKGGATHGMECIV